MKERHMEIKQEKIRSLWVPLRGLNLLLPSAAVAEIGSYRVPRACTGVPEWFLGMVKWREREIPVISLESLCGLPRSANPVFSRLMIVNPVRAGSTVASFAVVTAGLPGLIQLGNDMVDEVNTYVKDGLKCMVRIGSEEAAIPDLDYLQGLLEQQLDAVA
jgi:chemosensory pili system protein ChpC